MYTDKMAAQYLSLGLFIVLLSFFLVLNSMSSFEEEKTQAVFESLSDAFLTKFQDPVQTSSSKTAPEGDAQKEGDALDKVLHAFRSTIPDITARKNRFGNVLTMQMDRSAFEDAILGVGDQEQRLSYIISGLMVSKETITHEVAIVLHTAKHAVSIDDADQLAQTQQLSRQGAQYLQALQDAGMKPYMMTLGLMQGDPTKVSLIFRHFYPARLDLARQVDIAEEG